MTKQALGTLIAFLTLAAFQARADLVVVKNTDLSPCLNVLNTETVQLKGHIKTLNDDGSSFAVTPVTESGPTAVYTKSGAYVIPGKRNAKCEPIPDQQDSTDGTLSLMAQATALGNDPTNSEANKRHILQVCQQNPNIKKAYSAPPSGGNYPATPFGGVR